MSDFKVGQRVRAVASRPSGNGDTAEFTVEQVGPNFLATNYLQFINSFWIFELIEEGESE